MIHYRKTAMIALLAGFFVLCGAGQALAAQYTVKSGDTLYSISRRYNTTVNTIMTASGLKSTVIYPGQVLTVPSGTTNYTVKSGDTLYLIGQRFNTTAANLMQMNGLKSAVIYPG